MKRRKPSILDPYKTDIEKLVNDNKSIKEICVIINDKLPVEIKLSYNNYVVYVNKVRSELNAKRGNN